MILSYREWMQLLADFTKAVRDDDYTKVSYNIWKNFNKVQKGVELKYSISPIGNFVWDIFSYPDGKEIVSGFLAQGKNFGSFLYGRFEEMIEFENKLRTDSVTLNSALATSSTYATTTADTFSYEYQYYPINNFAQQRPIEEKKEMNTKKIFNFDFGPCEDSVHMSMYGLAVKNQNGEWVSYDTNSGDIMNVEIFNFADGGKWFYKLPVAISKLATGDLVIHNKKFCYVTGFAEDTANPVVIDIFAGERKEILPQKSPFGFNFCTKVISFFDGIDMKSADSDNPFGNMWMFALMSQDGKSNDMLLPLMMMQSGEMDMSNPLMMIALMGDGKMNDSLLPFMLMMGNKKEG